MSSIKTTYVDKVRAIEYRLGEIYSTKTNTFYIITGIEYTSPTYWGGRDNNCRIRVTRLGKNLKSQGNETYYKSTEFKTKFKPLSEGQKLLFLHEEIKDV